MFTAFEGGISFVHCLAPHIVRQFSRALAASLFLFYLILLISCQSPYQKYLQHKKAGDEAFRRNSFGEAESEYRAAISEIEGDNGESVILMICLRSLAQVYIAENKYDEAETIYKRRIQLATTLPNDPVYTSTVYDDLATFYILRNRVEEAEPIYQHAISLTEEAYGSNDLRVAEKLDYYAVLLKAKGHDSDANNLEQRASILRRKT